MSSRKRGRAHWIQRFLWRANSQFCLWPLSWAPEEGGWYRLELPKESLWFVAWERDMGEQLLKTLYWVIL